MAPVDTTSLPNGSNNFDLVVSNLVMQCIQDTLVVPVLRESARLLKPQGWAIHRIRMTDEYAFTDPERHHLHFLTYRSETWNKWFNHRLKNQNRWRASQFLNAFRDVGFLQLEVERHLDTSGVSYFQEVPLAPEFQSCPEEDISTIGMDIVLQKPPVANPVGDLQPESVTSDSTSS